jgi:hypothetical protein
MAAAYQLAAGATPASFTAVPLPNENDFPSGGPRLFDWISFASLAVPIRDNAHRFTVLIPSSPSETAAQRNRRVDVVGAVVSRERPAHTDFEIKPFWALFQAGSARLGLDTALGEGARFTAIELGRTALGEGFLAYGHPWNVIDRAVVGRDATSRWPRRVISSISPRSMPGSTTMPCPSTLKVSGLRMPLGNSRTTSFSSPTTSV